MATLTLSYDGRSKLARSVVDLIRSLDVFTITEAPAKPKRKSGIELAYEDVAAGRVTKWESTEQMFNTLMAQ